MKTFKTLLAAALVATTLMAAAPADAQEIQHMYVEAYPDVTFVKVLLTEPLEADMVLVEVFVNGELWKFQAWWLVGGRVIETSFNGEPPAGELTINVTPL